MAVTCVKEDSSLNLEGSFYTLLTTFYKQKNELPNLKIEYGRSALTAGGLDFLL